MAMERLSVILELIAGGYKKEAREAAVATGQISNATRTADTFVSRMAGGMQRASAVIKTALAGAAVGAVVEVLGNLDELGQKMESTERMAETVFGNMVADARAWADQNNEAFGIGESALLSLFSKTQDLLVPMGFVREEAMDMSKEILNVANALSEWEGGTIKTEDAQLRLAKAMLGEREGLVELGVKITDEEVKAELARRGLDKLTGAAKQQAIAQVTLALVVGKSTDALKAYEGRAGTATAAAKEQAATVEDTAESWAELLRGPLDEAKGTFGDVADIAQFLSEKMEGVGGAAGEAEEGSSGLVRIWEVMNPIGALLKLTLEKVADATQNTVAPSEEAAAAARFMADAQKDDLIPVVFDTIKMLDNQNTSHRNVAAAADSQRSALIRLADYQRSQLSPISNFIHLQEELVTAQETLATAQANGETPASDLALAQLGVADAMLAITAAGLSLNAEEIQAFAQLLVTQFGYSEEAAQNLLEQLGLFDGFVANVKVNFEVANASLLEAIGSSGINNTDIQVRHRGGVVDGPRGSEQLILAQAGEGIIPLSQMGRGGSTSNTRYGGTVIVMSPFNNAPQDLQYGALLANHATFGKF